MSSPKTVGELLQETLDKLGERIEALETTVEQIQECDECFLLFANNSSFQQHLCRGSQGR